MPNPIDVDSMLLSRDSKDKAKEKRAKEGASKAKKVVKLTKKQQQIVDFANSTVLPDNYHTIWTRKDLNWVIKWLSDQGEVAIDTETLGLNPFRDEIVGISLYAPDVAVYIPLLHEDHQEIHTGGEVGIDYVKCLPKDLVADSLRKILQDKSKKFIFHNWKFDRHVLHNWMSIDVTAYFDTSVAQGLLDETVPRSLKDLATRYLKIPADKFSTIFGASTKFSTVPILLDPRTRTGNISTYYAAKDAELTFKLYKFQSNYLFREDFKDLHNLMFNLEMPVADIMYRAEQRGVAFDTNYMVNEVSPKLHKELAELEESISNYVGDINLNSPKQLSEKLYGDLKLPRLNKKKPNSTDKKTLKKLVEHHPIASLLLRYRSLSKLTSSFADKLPGEVIDGVVHGSFNPLGTRTGRFSSSNPNLQQIPSNIGPLIRSAFVARPGRLLVSADFSGQEMRWLAHVSQDPTLLDIFISSKDAHSMTATTIWNMKNPDDLVTYEEFMRCREVYPTFTDRNGEIDEGKLADPDLISRSIKEGLIKDKDPVNIRADILRGKAMDKVRKKAKTVNFGVVYGIQEQGLSDQLEITEIEAKEYIEAFFETYPVAHAWMESVKRDIDYRHYITTHLGRKRRLYNEMRSGQQWLIESAYRKGINAIIQGSSADQTKLAMVALQPLLEELDGLIVLQVHDELIFDLPETVGYHNLERISEVMCNVVQLDCGMNSDIEAGYRWSQVMDTEEVDALKGDITDGVKVFS